MKHHHPIARAAKAELSRKIAMDQLTPHPLYDAAIYTSMLAPHNAQIAAEQARVIFPNFDADRARIVAARIRRTGR